MSIFGIKSLIQNSLAHHIFCIWKGEPKNNEVSKCIEIAWFCLDGLPEEMSHFAHLVLRAIRIELSAQLEISYITLRYTLPFLFSCLRKYKYSII